MTRQMDTIRQYLAVSESEAERIRQDRSLSEEGKISKIAQVRARTAELARGEADLWLSGLSRQARQATEAHDAALSEYRSGIDVRRESLAQQRIAILAEHGDWEEIAEAKSQALAAKDAAELRALATVAPLVRNRFKSDHRYAMDAGAVGPEVKRALGDLEPADLKAKRAAHEKAEAQLFDARGSLDTLRFEYGTLKNQPMKWLDDLIFGKPETVQTIDEDGRMSFSTTGGRGPFG